MPTGNQGAGIWPWDTGRGWSWRTSIRWRSWPFWTRWRAGTLGLGPPFLTWCGLRLKSAFTEATGQRTQRDRQDPLQAALSLDAPLTDAEEDPLVLEDVIEDPQAAQALDRIGDWDALHKAVEDLPEAQRAAVWRRYWLGQKVDSKAHSAALRALRHPRVSRTLRAYLT